MRTTTRGARTIGGRWLALPLLLPLLTSLAPPAAAQDRYHEALDPRHFPVPSVLVPNVEF
jgi:hypothetical protein